MVAVGQDYPITPLPFTRVEVNDAFWRSRLETNLRVTVPYTLERCRDTGRVANFARAAGRADGPHEGTQFNDSDVYKVIEGASYALLTRPDPALEAELDALIELITAAQEEDGYLYTSRTIAEARGTTAALNPSREGKERWSHLYMSHELYDLGHLFEAAAAHAEATGKRSLLEVALRSAALLERVFGEAGRFEPPGHQEVEIGLVKLYRLEGDPALLTLAKRFLAARGRHERRASYGEYAQDHLPVERQTTAVGHAVRAGYMYSALADVVALTRPEGGEQRAMPGAREAGEAHDPGETNDRDKASGQAEASEAGERHGIDETASWLHALDTIWRDVVGSKLYLTGGIGARHEGEAFGEPFELPNATAYGETCAAIANIMWNHRMFLLHGDARYLDVLERTLYNGFLAGVSLEGDRFFYPNPLASDGATPFNVGEGATRSPWFHVSCCPTNVVRAMPSMPGYVYAQRGSEVFVNLYVGSRARLEVDGVGVELEQTTEYPWDGDVRIRLSVDAPVSFALRLRIPGWSLGRPVPSELYQYLTDTVRSPVLRVNGSRVNVEVAEGFAVVARRWTEGDEVSLHLPMPVQRVVADEAVEEDRGRVAVERGPLVYCAEEVDNQGDALGLRLDDDAPLRVEDAPDLLGGVRLVVGTGCTLVPYYAWSHRGAGEMAVWLERGRKAT